MCVYVCVCVVWPFVCVHVCGYEGGGLRAVGELSSLVAARRKPSTRRLHGTTGERWNTVNTVGVDCTGLQGFMSIISHYWPLMAGK